VNVVGAKIIVLLGVMSRFPVAGEIWETVHYLVGLRRLGYDVYYVEAHGQPPLMLAPGDDNDGSAMAAAFIAGLMQRFDLGGRWAYHALHADGRYYGLTKGQLRKLYRSAALLINYHGSTWPLPEHSANGRLIYLETDPVSKQVALHHGDQSSIDMLAQHCAFFTWGENYGNPDCGVPLPDRFRFRPTRPPVVLDLWETGGSGSGQTFTTIGNWRQPGRDIVFQGELYHWSKHHEFLKIIDLPRQVNRTFELALSKCNASDKRLLRRNGWKVRNALRFSLDPDAYRRYILGSRGEFTVAKDQNVRLRSGWFSERSAQYLAAGRPVITQETGFSSILPTGQGLFAFLTMAEIVQAVESIDSCYEQHCRAASALAREYFSYDVVLPRMLAEVGL
jgi:hypothetical protein